MENKAVAFLHSDAYASILHHKSPNGFPVYAFLTERCSIALELSNPRIFIVYVVEMKSSLSLNFITNPKRIRTLKNLSQVTMLFTQNGLI